MNRIALSLSLLLTAACSAVDEAPAPEVPVRVLIVTGEEHGGHVWQETAPRLEAILEGDARLEVDRLEDLSLLANTDLAPYAAVMMHFKNHSPESPGRAGFDHLASYVDGGGGLVLVHFACGAFEEFRDDFEDLVGRVWFGLEPPEGRHQHDPYGEFTVRIADAAHPITADLEEFVTADELYSCLIGAPPVHVVADAVSTVDGRAYPMALTKDTGAGRVFLCTLGHDLRALEAGGVGELYRRGTAWAAHLAPE